jgi:hypothetical protein
MTAERIIFDARLPGPYSRGYFADLDTGMPIRWVLWASWVPGQVGDFIAFCVDPLQAKRRGLNPQTLQYRGRARLRFDPLLGNDFAQPQQLGHRVRIRPYEDRRCERRTCDRMADYLVAEETADAPTTLGGIAFEGATLRTIHYYCWRHFREPTLWLTPKERIVQHVEGGRPQ